MAKPGPKPSGNAKTQRQRSRDYRERQARELAQLRVRAEAATDVEQLRRELAQQREIVQSTLSELARVEDERDRLRLEVSRLKRSEAEPSAGKRRGRK